MFQHPDSVRSPARVPLRHPYFETFRDRQRDEFRREVAEAVRRADDLRARLASARILETVQ